MNLCILAFNIGSSRVITNGPGMSLLNFVKGCKNNFKNLNITVYTDITTDSFVPGVNFRQIRSQSSLKNDISKADLVHYWSGSTDRLLRACLIASDLKKPIVLGPNLLDGVNAVFEERLLNKINYHKIFVVNRRLKFMLSKMHAVDISMFEQLIVGPDLDLWSPPESYDEYILWKGNSLHKVKDIEFARRVREALPQYEFLFMGEFEPYNYERHVERAKRAALYFTTSISETKGMALLEQLAAGVPSVSNPRVMQHGINYETGIIGNKTVEDYSKAIVEIMEDKQLRSALSFGARSYMVKEFSDEVVSKKYMSTISNII